jgi:hypothetical protein
MGGVRLIAHTFGLCFCVEGTEENKTLMKATIYSTHPRWRQTGASGGHSQLAPGPQPAGLGPIWPTPARLGRQGPRHATVGCLRLAPVSWLWLAGGWAPFWGSIWTPFVRPLWGSRSHICIVFIAVCTHMTGPSTDRTK